MRIPHGLRAALAGQAAPPAPNFNANFENVSLLLHGDGTNGAQNNTFVDGSTNNFSITRNGNTTQGTFSPFSPTGWSGYFDGNGDYLRYATNTSSQFSLGTNNFTDEVWVYPSAFNAGNTIISGQTQTNGGALWSYVLYLNGSGQPGVLASASSGGYLVNFLGTAIPLNTWTHLAVTRNGNTFTLWRNGVSDGTATSSVSISQDATASYGGWNVGGGPQTTQFHNGYLSNSRLVNGTALYTSNFTPPTSPLTAITNTSLLTLQDNRFKDNSTNNFAITRFGDTRIEAFSPFNPTAAYSAGTHGGSGYFDGTGDYLTAPANSAYDFGTGNFTVELWFNRVAPKGQSFHDNLVGNRPSGFSSGMWHIYVGAAANDPFTWQARTPAGDLSISGGVCRNTEWNHVAVVRNGNTITLYVNGTAVNSLSTTTSIGSSANTFSVGAFTDGSFPCIGYFSDVRVLKGTALYTSNFTPPTAPLTVITNTSLLLNFTNAGIIDNASKNVLETVGNTQISTSVKKFGTGSMYFDGTGDYLRSNPATSNLYAFGTGNFTIEFWLYLNTTAGDPFFIDFRPTSTQGAYPTLYSSSGTLRYYANTGDRITGGTLATGTWLHIALCRHSGSTRMFINGSQTGSTYADSINYLCPAGRPFIGIDSRATLGALNGYIDDLRITSGVARYTANFTPPTQAFFDL